MSNDLINIINGLAIISKFGRRNLFTDRGKIYLICSLPREIVDNLISIGWKYNTRTMEAYYYTDYK